MRKTIAVLTSSRADYSHLYWVLVELSQRPDLRIVLVTIGSHLSAEFGNTQLNIATDNFAKENIECLLSSDTDIGMAKTIGLATLGLADYFGKLRPDLILIVADRYEMLAPASVALALRIPIAHIEGGDISQGAIDDAVRNALTKLSHIHFTTTERSRQRVISMGEEAWRVHTVGSPSLDHLTKSILLPREEIEKQLRISLKEKTIAIIYHPVTIARDTLFEVEALLTAVGQLSQQLLFIGPNPDAGSRELSHRLSRFAKGRSNTHFIASIDHLTYMSLLPHLIALVGNSSSGIMEAASFELPVVNVGLRQQGRERARNVLDCAADRTDIWRALQIAISGGFRESLQELENPYGDGHAAEKVAGILATTHLSEALLIKEPSPLRCTDEYANSPR